MIRLGTTSTVAFVFLFSMNLCLAQVVPFHGFTDVTPHTSRMITVDTDVRLEVLDWGGSGRALILLTGLGDTAHDFDRFAPKLTGKYHVYGITRRGFGKSSSPATGYSADRLGDDVLAVMDSLKLNKPILVGHSIAGEELSSIGSRHPEKVAGLVYLDAGYTYAYYDPSHPDFHIDLIDFKRKIDRFDGIVPLDKTSIQDLLEALPALEGGLRDMLKQTESMPPSTVAAQPPLLFRETRAVLAGEQKYTSIPVPALAIFAVPDNPGPVPEAVRLAKEAQAAAFEHGVPTAHVVRLLHADHYVFQSNESDVVREMNAFIAALP